MYNKPENPHAFPRTASAFKDNNGQNIVMDNGCEGMTLRDYFAAKTLQGLFASDTDEHEPINEKARAKYCYKMADAMLKARQE